MPPLISQKQTVAKTAASVVVSTSAEDSDAQTIAAGLALLPAAGGTLYIRAGTYAISTTLTLPDKHVTIIGAGRGAVLIDLGANAIAAFTFTNTTDRAYSFHGFRVNGTAIAGQKVFHRTGADIGTIPMHVSEVDVSNVLGGLDVEKIFQKDAGGWILKVSDCDFNVGGLAGSAVADITSGGASLRFARVRMFGTSRILGNPDCRITDSNFSAPGTSRYEFGIGSTIKGCTFVNGGVVEIAEGTRFIGNRMTAGSVEVLASVTDATIAQNIFEGVKTRHIDILAGAAGVTVNGNTFAGHTSEAIQLDSTDCHIHANGNCSVTELFAADRNRFSQIDAANSTIRGASSEVWATAATVVVDQDGNGDATTIAEGLNRLGDIGGGTLFIREGTYSISASLALTTFSVASVIRGAGMGATIIDIGATNSPIFTASSQSNPVEISDLEVRGTNLSAQAFLSFGASGVTSSRPLFTFRRIRIGTAPSGALSVARVIINSASSSAPWKFSFWDCEIFIDGTFTNATTIALAGTTTAEAHFTRCLIQGNGGYSRASGTLDLFFTECTAAFDEEVNVSSIHAVNTTFTRGASGIHTSTVTLVAQSKFIGCIFEAAGEVTNDIHLTNFAASRTLFSGCTFNDPTGGSAGPDHNIRIDSGIDFVKIIGCTFRTSASPIAVSEIRCAGDNLIVSACKFEHGSVPIHIDLEVGAVAAQITGNNFGGINTAVRIATVSCNVAGNLGCEVEEIGAANLNDYSGNSGFSGSTIIGVDSRVNGMVFKTVDPGATDDDTAYFEGDRWLNTVSGEVFICVDNTSSAAIWTSITGGGAATNIAAAEDVFVHSMIHILL